jgi:hypothetical protein
MELNKHLLAENLHRLERQAAVRLLAELVGLTMPLRRQ